MSTKPTLLSEYRPPAFSVESTELRFELDEGTTQVSARLQLVRNSDPLAPADADLRLDGENLELVELRLDGQILDPSRYTLSANGLQVHAVPERFVLESVCTIRPEQNTSLSGLYRSRNMYCTQCEAEGFRRITWYPDRPDVLSVFTTTIVADARKLPVLLSNGNLTSERELANGRREVTWHDPFPKPSYLFALVAGDLARIEDRFTTAGGRHVDIHMYVEPKDLDKCDHALRSLKKAMRWDEEVYGREYDLDVFMIVAVDDFNMGAMENKGLNIFNTSAVLANPETATDARYQWVEGVVAHEYFHNWSGNRVTCRDWFQLSLKEGFTVYRDSEFSADMNSRPVKRIESVRNLRTIQFAEDSGPLAHPVQPRSYLEISNFYTSTIYEKGAEVVRMIAQLLGPENFRRGTDLYFERHDGEAATIEDFIGAMAEVSGMDFSRFMNWYRQAGTPQVDVESSWDEKGGTYELSLSQSCPATPDSASKQPFLIPLRVALIGPGGPLPLHGEAVEEQGSRETVLQFSEARQTFRFSGVSQRPVPSLLRGFSAPVRLRCTYDPADLVHLVRHDDDGFVRWDACQQLTTGLIEGMQRQPDAAALKSGVASLLDLFRTLLGEAQQDPAMSALLLVLPSEEVLAGQAEPIDVDAIHTAREALRKLIATDLKPEFARCWRSMQVDEPYRPDAAQIARRSLKNVALAYWLASGDADAEASCVWQFDSADNMTDRFAALSALVNSAESSAAAQRALDSFYARWHDEPLVVNQWLAVQSASAVTGSLERIEQLMEHEAFDLRNPNKVRSVIGTFASQNPVHFHRLDGAGYRFLADQVLALNAINPQIASRLVVPLTRWRKHLPQRAQLMKSELERIRGTSALSPDVEEMVIRALD